MLSKDLRQGLWSVLDCSVYNSTRRLAVRSNRDKAGPGALPRCLRQESQFLGVDDGLLTWPMNFNVPNHLSGW